MARVSNEESIAMGQERVMKDKWFRSSHSMFVSTIQSTISWVLSLFTKAEPPPPPAPQTTQPPPPPPLISNSTSINFSPNSSTFRYQPSPPNPTIFEQNEHVVDIPTTTDSSSEEALLAPMRCPCKARPTSTRYSGESSTTAKQSEGTNLPASIVENTNNNTQVSPQPITQPPQMLNPIVQLLRDQELGKTVLTIVIPMTTAVLSVYAKDKDSSSLTLPLTLLSLCMGLAALWNGILIRNRFPNAANGVEQFGAASIFFAFFLVVSSLLPPKFVWLPWACFVAILFPSALSFVAPGDTAHDTPVN